MAARLRYQLRLRTDWFRVTSDLERTGYSLPRAAKCIGAPRSTVRDWRYGSEPPHNYGILLLELWCEATGKDLRERPMIED